MDTIVFDGIEYVKASVAAKQFRYTSDYIGQLCRSGKIDARLVGRTWFVSIDSINKYRAVKKNKLKVVAKNKPEIAIEIKTVRKMVPPVLTAKAAQVLSYENNASRTKKLHVSYDLDEESLLPNLTKRFLPKPRLIPIEPANATRLKIFKDNQKAVSFIAEDLPEVSLTGKLVIEDYPEIELEAISESVVGEQNTLENKAITDKSDIEPELKLKVTGNDKVAIIKTKKVTEGAMLSELKKARTIPIAELSKPLAINNDITKHKFTPKAVLPQSVESTSFIFRFLPLITTFIAITLTFVFWSLSSDVYVSGLRFDSGLVFDFANLSKILDL